MVYDALTPTVPVYSYADAIEQFPEERVPLRYGLSRLTPQPPGNVRWRSVRGPCRNGSAPPG